MNTMMQCQCMQNDDWVATTYNSLPSCGAAELKQKTIMAMNAFRNHSKGQVHFAPCSGPLEMPCVAQQNLHDCGMSVAGFALTLALGLNRSCVPSEFSAQLRAKWCSAISDGLKTDLPVLLDETFLVI